MQEDDWLDSMDRYKELPDSAPPVAPPSAKRKRSHRPQPRKPGGKADAPAAPAAAPQRSVAGGLLPAVHASAQQPPWGAASGSDVLRSEGHPSAASEKTRDGGAVASAAGTDSTQPLADAAAPAEADAAGDGPQHTPKAKRRKRMVVKVTPTKACPEGSASAAEGVGPASQPLQPANQLKRPMWPKGPGRTSATGSHSGACLSTWTNAGMDNRIRRPVEIAVCHAVGSLGRQRRYLSRARSQHRLQHACPSALHHLPQQCVSGEPPSCGDGGGGGMCGDAGVGSGVPRLVNGGEPFCKAGRVTGVAVCRSCGCAAPAVGGGAAARAAADRVRAGAGEGLDQGVCAAVQHVRHESAREGGRPPRCKRTGACREAGGAWGAAGAPCGVRLSWKRRRRVRVCRRTARRRCSGGGRGTTWRASTS